MRVSVFALLVLCFVACSSRNSAAEPNRVRGEGESASLPRAQVRPVASDFDGGSAWLNVKRPLRLSDLRGRIVVVDFWTSCCINCLQTLPTLKRVEEQFTRGEVVVVGVHSPKFANERKRDRLAELVAQYDIRHPIVIDSSMSIWERWGVRAWPTVFVIDAESRVIWEGAGEPNANALLGVVRAAVEEAKTSQRLARVPFSLLSVHSESDKHPLYYPGNVATLRDGGLAVSDTGHHRIVLLDAAGRMRAVVGSGVEGSNDGPPEQATFRRPHGLVAFQGALYVADTDNHVIRKIDLGSLVVSTIAGAGILGDAPLGDGWQSLQTPLRSPWDLVVAKGRLFIALAGSHQIGELDVSRRRIRAFAGTGLEARQDGPAHVAAFAQPSGLATDGERMFVADSETSSVRAISIQTGEVRTLVGKDLFVFGDRDGDQDEALLQHPLGVAFARPYVYVSDTYNSKIRKIDLHSKETTSVFGGGDHRGLFEPSGIVGRGEELVIADTNHHKLVRLSLSRGGAQSWIPEGLSPPSLGRVNDEAAPLVAAPSVQLGPIAISRRGVTRLRLRWDLPAGTAGARSFCDPLCGTFL